MDQEDDFDTRSSFPSPFKQESPKKQTAGVSGADSYSFRKYLNLTEEKSTFQPMATGKVYLEACLCIQG